MPTIKVDAVTKESKEARGRKYWGVKVGNDWINVVTDTKPEKGQTLQVGEIKVSESGGRTYRWAQVDEKAQQSKQANNNGHIPWHEYERLARVAHTLALSLEPDETGSEAHFEDRSQARIALVQTVLVALRDGKVALPKDEPEEGPPAEDDIPF